MKDGARLVGIDAKRRAGLITVDDHDPAAGQRRSSTGLVCGREVRRNTKRLRVDNRNAVFLLIENPDRSAVTRYR